MTPWTCLLLARAYQPGPPRCSWHCSSSGLSSPVYVNLVDRSGSSYLPPPLPLQDLLAFRPINRSEEHTSELQSRGHLVCRLLLEKKNFPAHCSRTNHAALPAP